MVRHVWRKKGWWSVLGSASSFFWEEYRVGFFPTRSMLSQIFFMNKLGLDRENRTGLWNHPCAMARIRSQSLLIEIGNVDNWILFSFPILFVFALLRKRKEGPAPSGSRKVALTWSTLWVIFYFLSMGAGKGYNSVVECHLDVVEVISSSLIIPTPM